MTNQEIAAQFNLLGKLLELKGENQFKTRSYSNAYQTLRKHPDPVMDMTLEELNELPSIGKTIVTKINEIRSTGELQALKSILETTPKGIVDMIQIKGLGPQKVKKLWEGLDIDNPIELLSAINEGRVQELKGFGAKSVATLKEQIEYHLESESFILYAEAEPIAARILQAIRGKTKKGEWTLAGTIARKCDTIDRIELLTTLAEKEGQSILSQIENISLSEEEFFYEGVRLEIHFTTQPNFYYDSARLCSHPDFWKNLKVSEGKYASEAEVFEKNNLPYYIPEFREAENVSSISTYPSADEIVSIDHIKGCIHNHSTYSDGVNTLKEMYEAAAEKGFEYMVITDHSRSAFYANGLSIERLHQQMDEIIEIDRTLEGFSCFSGIESDILSDGSLDYPDEILGELDVVIASVHSNLRMDKEKATKRLLTAIENPYTSILGHMTGRLLLRRPGYPVDHDKIIDACAANEVAIELNANPRRLDMDWRFIQKAVGKGVLIAINPDAHSIKGIDDIAYGVHCARKAGLPIHQCLNTMDIDEFQDWMSIQHEKRG